MSKESQVLFFFFSLDWRIYHRAHMLYTSCYYAHHSTFTATRANLTHRTYDLYDLYYLHDLFPVQCMVYISHVYDLYHLYDLYDLYYLHDLFPVQCMVYISHVSQGGQISSV